MEKKILTEINRYRELMNLSILNEGRDDIVNGIAKAAKKVFANASSNSAEDVFKKELINATTESEIKRIIQYDAKLARKVIRQAIIDSGAKFYIDIESRIIYFINEGKDASFIKAKVKVYFDKHVSGVLKEDILKNYNKSIDGLYSRQNTPQQVFGRDVGPYKPKLKPDTNNLPSTTQNLPSTTTIVQDSITRLESSPFFRQLGGDERKFLKNNINEIGSENMDDAQFLSWMEKKMNIFVNSQVSAGIIKRKLADERNIKVKTSIGNALDSFSTLYGKTGEASKKAIKPTYQIALFCLGLSAIVGAGLYITNKLPFVKKGGEAIIDKVEEELSTTPAETETKLVTPPPVKIDTTGRIPVDPQSYQYDPAK